jgi:hydroxyacylglutathione hydrolase
MSLLLAVGFVLVGCAGRSVGPRSAQAPEVVRLERKYINSYLLIGERVVVVDTGVPGNAKRVLRALARRGFKPQDVALIVLTHGHADHAGSAAALRERTGAPIVTGDAALTRRGHNDRLKPTGPAGRRVLPFIGQDYPAFVPDRAVEGELDLHPFGVAGRVLAVPGHTPGSLAVLLDDGQAIGGDLVRGKILARERPTLHFFHADPEGARRQLAGLLDRGVTRLHPGHGHALTAADLRAFLEK